MSASLSQSAAEFSFRSVFISDIHLGTPQAQATLLLPFLQKVRHHGCFCQVWWCRASGAILTRDVTPANSNEKLVVHADPDTEVIPGW